MQIPIKGSNKWHSYVDQYRSTNQAVALIGSQVGLRFLERVQDGLDKQRLTQSKSDQGNSRSHWQQDWDCQCAKKCFRQAVFVSVETGALDILAKGCLKGLHSDTIVKWK